MRTKILIGVLAAVVVGGTVLLCRNVFGGGSDELGCYARSGVAVFADISKETKRVDCGQAHDFEAIGLLGQQDPEGRCRKQVEDFLGGRWELSRTAWATLGSHDPMNGTLLCALMEVDGTDTAPVSRTGTLRDGLRGAKPLAITCLTGAGAGAGDGKAHFAGCTEAHTAEFAGDVPAGDDATVEAACRTAVAQYAGVPDLARRPGLDVNWLTRDGVALCLAVTAKDTPALHGSVKGVGTGPLP